MTDTAAHADPRIGTVLPDADLITPNGDPVRLGEILAGQPAVIVFYRGAWCPYCNPMLHRYELELREPLAERGVQLVAMSPEKPDGSLSIIEKQQLRFTVLSDPGSQVAESLGLVFALDEEQLEAYRGHGFEITDLNADGRAALVHPATAVVTADGAVDWLDVHEDFTTRTESDDIIRAVDALLAR